MKRSALSTCGRRCQGLRSHRCIQRPSSTRRPASWLWYCRVSAGSCNALPILLLSGLSIKEILSRNPQLRVTGFPNSNFAVSNRVSRHRASVVDALLVVRRAGRLRLCLAKSIEGRGMTTFSQLAGQAVTNLPHLCIGIDDAIGFGLFP